MDVSRSGRLRKKPSLLNDYDTAENSQVHLEELPRKGSDTSTEEVLESLDSLVESNFNETLASTIVNSRESLYLSIWKQPNDNYRQSVRMKFLPLFYVVCSVEKDNVIVLKLITYHGKNLNVFLRKSLSMKMSYAMVRLASFPNGYLLQGNSSWEFKPEGDV